MKRTLSILMLLMANVLILAHAVIPHHHHDKVAVAIEHFWEEGDAHHHSHDGEAHHHDGPEDCFLTEALEEALVKDAFSEIEPLLIAPQLPLLQLFNWEAIVSDAAPAVEALQYLRHPFRQKPYLTNVYLAFVANQLGFRAPPFC